MWKKYREPITYIVFGVLTTVVNIAVYYVFTEPVPVYYLLANALAWLLSVLFAFVTNKVFVFESKSWRFAVAIPEMGTFFLARIATGVMDMALMWLLVDVISVQEMWAKIVVNVLVVVANYLVSKLWIFRS